MPAYSNTPLAKKLGIRTGNTVYLIGAPDYYFDLFSDLPSDLQLLEDPEEMEPIDFIHFFGRSKANFAQHSLAIIPLLKKDGMLWASWPKGASGFKTDLKRDWIREYLLGLGLVDVKVASVNNVWSGLKFVYRVKDR